MINYWLALDSIDVVIPTVRLSPTLSAELSLTPRTLRLQGTPKSAPHSFSPRRGPAYPERSPLFSCPIQQEGDLSQMVPSLSENTRLQIATGPSPPYEFFHLSPKCHQKTARMEISPTLQFPASARRNAPPVVNSPDKTPLDVLLIRFP